MRTVHSSGRLSFHTCPLPSMPPPPPHVPPCHICPLPCMPPAVHAPCHACPLSCTPPTANAPCHAHPQGHARHAFFMVKILFPCLICWLRPVKKVSVAFFCMINICTYYLFLWIRNLYTWRFDSEYKGNCGILKWYGNFRSIFTSVCLYDYW